MMYIPPPRRDPLRSLIIWYGFLFFVAITFVVISVLIMWELDALYHSI